MTFEGGEGSGKTTQIRHLADFLRARGRRVVTTREPGGSPGAEAVRHVILSGAAQDLGNEMEAILFAAARADHVAALIKPALERGEDVLCDRFHDSTRVYQGLVPDADPDLLDRLEEASLQGVYPDLTFILDLPAADGLRRAAARRRSADADRFERESPAIHEERREAFLAIAALEPERCHVIDALRPADLIAAEIAAIAAGRLELGEPPLPSGDGRVPGTDEEGAW